MPRKTKYFKVEKFSFINEAGFREVNRNGRKRSKPMVAQSVSQILASVRGREKLINFVLGFGVRT